MLATTRGLLSQDVLPTALVFAVIVWLLARYRRGGRGTSPAPTGSLAGTIAGGFVVFVVMTGGISLLAGESLGYIGRALAGGAILAFGIVAPLAALAVRVGRRATP